jgi:hypothetical protein
LSGLQSVPNVVGRRKASFGLLRIDQRTIAADVEYPAIALDQLDRQIRFLLERGLQPGGLGQIISTHAVFDGEMHGCIVTPAVPQPLRTALTATAPLATVATAIVVASWCLTLPWTYGGWFALVPGIALYTVVCLGHFLVHLRAAREVGGRRHLVHALAFSHIALVIAFLLQWDTGDGPTWLIITAMMGTGPGHSDSAPPGWWPGGSVSVALNFALFVPVLWMWRRLRRQMA